MSVTSEATQKKITLIQPQPSLAVDRKKYAQLRVAAYCRVSTDSEEQLTSYKMQKKVYTEMIQAKKEWCLAGIYADEGISGTRADKRKAFQQLMKDCQKGKIDYIITKSVSRFARNTAECIEYARRLKLMGIGIIFEEQNCDTLKCDSELLLTIHAGFAQAESESMSRNITWSVRKRFENGQVIFNYRNMVGYKKGENGQPVVIPAEAETVRLIFDMFLSGFTARQICQKLKEERLPSKSGKPEWSPSTILSILKNERYTGDAILQKTYTIDPIQKTKRVNYGEVPMYLVENNHPAIIDRKTFNRTQEELARRSSKKSATPKNTIAGQGRYSRYALSEVLRCGCCGTLCRRTLWTSNGTKRAVWRCCKRMDYGKQYCPDSHSVNETELHAAIVRAMDRFTKEDATRFHDTVKSSIAEALGLTDESPEEIMIKHKIGLLNQEIMTLVDLSLSEEVPLEDYEEKFAEISAEIGTLNARLEAIHSTERTESEKEEEVARLLSTLDELKNCGTEYNDNAVRQMIECIKVYPDGKLEIIFGGGYTIIEQVEVLK